jgi:hypothetical protein
MPEKSSADALDHLAAAVENLIAAAERSKRQESVHFWESIEQARESLRAARLEMRAAGLRVRDG